VTVTWNDDEGLAHLSPRVRAAIGLVGSDRDLRLRTTLRRDVQVWTTFLVTAEVYETFVLAPRDVCEAMTRHAIPASMQYPTKDQADRGHAAYCGHVIAVLHALAATP